MPSLKDTLGLVVGDRICLGGDSITAGNMYAHYMAAWLQLTYPELDLDTFVVARSGSSLSGWATAPPVPNGASSQGLYERYHYPFSPDVVFLMHGQNGGQTAAAHGTNYESLWDVWIGGASAPDTSNRATVKLVMLGMHPVQAGTDTKSAEGKADAEAVFAAGNSRVFSSHTFDQMGAGWIANSSNAIDVRQLTGTPFAGGDSVHPGPAGHITIAWAALKGLGVETVVSQATINASTATSTSAVNCAVSNISVNRFGGVDFDRLDTKLPWAIDEYGRANATALYPDITSWQDYSLTVSALPAGIYTIYCGGVEIGTATSAELSNGWNMADLTAGPVWEQCQDVLVKVRALHGYNADGSVISPNTGTMEQYHSSTLSRYQNGNERGTTYYGNMQSAISGLSTRMGAVRAAATPVTRSYSVRLTGYTPPIGIPAPVWGSLHPITEPRPAQPSAWPSAAATGFYYVDNTHGSATDTANIYGHPNRPRLTIPEVTYAAGSYVEIHGGPYVRRSGDAEHDFIFAGTEANPCWMVAHDPLNRPEIQGGGEISGTYAIIDGIRRTRDLTTGSGPGTHFGGDSNSGTHHICLRNSEADGASIELPGSASTCMSITGSMGDETHHIVFYNVKVEDYGDIAYSQTVVYSDDHAFVPGQYSNNIWILNSLVHSAAGDAVQVTGNNASGEARASNIYIGGNIFYYTGENAVDVKSSVDVVVSQNTLYNFPGGHGGSGTAVVIQQEGGSGCDNIWIIFNEIYDCYEAVRAEETASDIYVIGNVMHAIYADGFAAITARTDETQITVVDNTIYGLAATIPGAQWDGQGGIAPDLQLHGNLWAGKTDNAAKWYDGDSTSIIRDSNRNAFDSASAFSVTWEGVTYNTLAAFQAGKAQDINGAYGNCALLDPVNGNFGIGSASVARGINVEHAAYAAFQSRYGLNIRYDFYGNPRPASGAWDAGALQYGSVRSVAAPPDPEAVTPPTFTLTYHCTPSAPTM